MITLQGKKKTVKMPSRLSEIPLYKGVEIMNVLGYIDEPQFNLKVSIICMLSGLKADTVLKFGKDKIERIYDQLEFSKDKEFYTRYYKSFSLNGQLYGIIDLENITVREYAEIEFWMKQGDYEFSYLHEILNVVYRHITVKNKTIKDILFNISSRLKNRAIRPVQFGGYELTEYREVSTHNNSSVFSRS